MTNCSLAMFNVLGQIGNVVAPYFFDEGDEPPLPNGVHSDDGHGLDRMH